MWFVPGLLVLAAGALFAVTYAIDQAAYRGAIVLPGWVNSGSADAGRQILSTIAVGVITVVALVFSITIVALTLVSTQFGPRMLRNFIRDRWTQFTLGVFIATFVYCILSLGSIAHGPRGDFVPHVSISVALAGVIADSGLLIFFIHHMARSIQLPEVIGLIARDLRQAIDDQIPAGHPHPDGNDEEVQRPEGTGAPVPAPASGYLQYVEHERLIDLARKLDAVIELLYRPGHYVARGLPLATVWPAHAAEPVTRELDRAHVTGTNRRLHQDLAFAIDQLVEIGLRALSSSVNDTFTALTCIDWLGDALCDISERSTPGRMHHDHHGTVRLIEAGISYERLVDRAFDKFRQAGRGKPAITIRLLESLGRIMRFARTPQQRDVIRSQADMILRSSEETIPDPEDRADVRSRYDALVAIGTD